MNATSGGRTPLLLINDVLLQAQPLCSVDDGGVWMCACFNELRTNFNRRANAHFLLCRFYEHRSCNCEMLLKFFAGFLEKNGIVFARNLRKFDIFV